jgi:hypothetical protein
MSGPMTNADNKNIVAKFLDHIANVALAGPDPASAETKLVI